MQVARDAVLWGWKDIAAAFGLSERGAPEIAKREGWPIRRLGDPTRGRVLMTGEAFHAWNMAGVLGVSLSEYLLGGQKGSPSRGVDSAHTPAVLGVDSCR